MYLDNLIFPVDLALVVGLFYTCPALEFSGSDNPSRHGRGVSNGCMVTLLVERHVQVLQIHCRCGTDPIEDSGPPPSYRSCLGACLFPLTLRLLILVLALHLFRMVLPHCEGYFSHYSLDQFYCFVFKLPYEGATTNCI